MQKVAGPIARNHSFRSAILAISLSWIGLQSCGFGRQLFHVTLLLDSWIHSLQKTISLRYLNRAISLARLACTLSKCNLTVHIATKLNLILYIISLSIFKVNPNSAHFLDAQASLQHGRHEGGHGCDMEMEVDKVADMVADMEVDMVDDMVADIEANMVADTEVDKVADMEADKVADMKVDMVADIEVYKVADIKMEMVVT